MNHQRRAAAGKQRFRAIAQIHSGIGDRNLRRTVSAHLKVIHVAGVRPHRIFGSVLLSVGIEVRAGRCEVWSFALGHLMNVNRVLAGRQIF